MSGHSACVRGILKEAQGLTDKEIDSVVNELQSKRASRARAGLFGDEAGQTSKDAEAAAKDLELAAQIEKRNAKINQLIYRQLHDDIGKFGNDATGLEAMVAGSNKHVEGGRLSVNALSLAREGKYLGGLVHDLREAKLLDYVVPRWLGVGKGMLDDKIAQELWELREDGKPGSTGSPEAKGAADIIHKYQELARTDQNLHGAFVRKLDGYIVSQSHDMFRIAAAGKQSWVNFVRPLLDAKTFDNIGLTGETKDRVRVDDFLGRVWSELSAGSFYKADTEAPLIGFKGPGNLAKKVSASRVLHFADAQSWISYNDKFGTGSLMEAVSGGLRHASRTTALLERFGPNPRAMFDRVLSDLRQKAIDGPKDVLDRLSGHWPSTLMDVADGTINIPAHISTQYLASTIRSLQGLARLGGAFLSSFQDVATGASELQYQGHNFFGALGEQFHSMLAQIGDHGERREAAELVGVGIDGVLRDVANRLTGADNTGRVLNKLSTAFFKLNLLEPWSTAGERGISAIMSRDLAMRKDLPFEKLPDRLQTVLSQYKITPEDWKTIAEHGVTKVDGTEYMDPSQLRGAGLEAHAADELESKVRAYFGDRSAVGIVIKGGIRERAYMTQGSQAGTGYGEATRFVMQFKHYGLAFVQKVLGRFAQEDRFWSIPGSLYKMPMSDKMQLAQLIATCMGMGYLSMAAKSIARGQVPPDPRRPATVVQAALHGGGMGFYGDFLLAQTNQMGGTLGDVVLGPTIGSATALGDIGLKMRDYLTGVEKKPPEMEAWQWAKSNTPFLNLFYTRAAMDYMILYRVQEMMNPGSLRRMEQRMKANNQQQFIVPPSSVIHR